MNRTTRNAGPRTRRAWAASAALACTVLSACATAPAPIAPAAAPAPASAAAHAATTASSPASPLPPSDGDTPSSAAVANLQSLIDSHQLTELRTTYNATYGASLLFQASNLGYYAVLFHGKQFWRVIRTDSYENAERIYRSFVAQTNTLGQVDIDATRLQAGNAYAEHLVALNRQRLQNLQQDASYQQQQARQVASAQQQAKQQAVSLSADLRSTSSQLDAMKQRIHALEQQQADPELALPASDAAPAPAASAATPGTASP